MRDADTLPRAAAMLSGLEDVDVGGVGGTAGGVGGTAVGGVGGFVDAAAAVGGGAAAHRRTCFAEAGPYR